MVNQAEALHAADQLAEAAQELVGTKFRLFGRDPEYGLDCVGLVAWSMKQAGQTPFVPEGYKLRNSDPSVWLACAGQSGLRATQKPVIRGDVLLLKPAPAQQHLVIAINSHECIHAHAGLRCVVRQQMDERQRLLAHWRLENKNA